MMRSVQRTNTRLLSEIYKCLVSLVVILGILLAGPSLSGAQSSSIPGNITIEEGGKVWIDGSAGPVNFQCNAERLSGAGEIENSSNPQATVQGNGQVTISVKLPVKALNCGKRAMNKDMYEALKSERFPTIHYKLLDAHLVDEPLDSTNQWMKIRTRGIMEIAGVEDTTSFDVQGKLLSNNRFQVKGSKNIHMDTFRIDPPRAMFGLIKANEKLIVHFNVTVNLANQGR